MPLIDISSLHSANDFIIHPTFSPTAKGVLLLNMLVDDTIKGKQVAVVGKGLTSGLPITLMYNQLGATVHTINSNTITNARYDIFNNSNIIVSCAGVDMTLFKNTWLYSDKICINVGMRKEEGKMIGDLDYNSISHHASFINPVLGTTGKLTTLFLIYNCLASQMTHDVINFNDTLKDIKERE